MTNLAIFFIAMAKYCETCKPGVNVCGYDTVWTDCPEGEQCALYYFYSAGKTHRYELACEGAYDLQQWNDYCLRYGNGPRDECGAEFN